MLNRESFDPNLILVVDDDRDFVEAVVAMLGSKMPDIKIVTAYDGNAGLGAFERGSPMPAVIILDMMLPKRSGFLVLEKIRRTSSVGNFPFVIMVTANQGSRHKSYAEMLGVFKYLIKPFDMQILLQAVQEAKEEIG